MKIKLLLSILVTSVLISGCSTMKEEKNPVTNKTEKDISTMSAWFVAFPQEAVQDNKK